MPAVKAPHSLLRTRHANSAAAAIPDSEIQASDEGDLAEFLRLRRSARAA